jgi:hypothetical protein
MKTDETRYVAVLQDNTIWWFAPGVTWQATPMDGLALEKNHKSVNP